MPGMGRTTQLTGRYVVAKTQCGKVVRIYTSDDSVRTARSPFQVTSPRHEILLQYDQIYHWGAIRVGDWKLVLDEGAQPYRCSPDQHMPEGDPNPTTTVVCAYPPSNDVKYLCSGMENQTCLFNIKEDPCEQINLATDRPVMVQKLMKRMEKYQTQTLWPRTRPYDSCVNPNLFNGQITTWLEFTGGEQYESQLLSFTVGNNVTVTLRRYSNIIRWILLECRARELFRGIRLIINTKSIVKAHKFSKQAEVVSQLINCMSKFSQAICIRCLRYMRLKSTCIRERDNNCLFQ